LSFTPFLVLISIARKEASKPLDAEMNVFNVGITIFPKKETPAA